MLDFVTNREDLRNELIDEIKLFFPYVDDCPYSIAHNSVISKTYKALKVENFVTINGKERLFVDFISSNAGELERKRLDKRAAKNALFNALKTELKTSPPWGSLTGIRPSKLVYDMLNEGVSIDECESEMQSRFSVSQRKAKLICDIVKNQSGYYSKDPELINLYIHIPFCTSKCSYCSFTTELLSRGKKLIPQYIKLLRAEIEHSVNEIKRRGKLCSVYVGGGTPTALEADEIAELFDGFDFSSVEFTVEAGRPDTITEDKLKTLKALGVNRVCVNPQTLNDITLKKIGRSHTATDFYEKYALVKAYGFSVNVDLIAGLTDESVDDFKNTVNGVLKLKPENVTVHTLSRKNGSALKNNGRYDNTEVGLMTEYAFDKLCESGYAPYYLYRQKQMLGNLENIGYCLPNKQCLNNITTMEDCVSVLACGAGAISKIVNGEENRIERFANVRDVVLYIKTFEEKLKDKSIFYEKQFTKPE